MKGCQDELQCETNADNINGDIVSHLDPFDELSFSLDFRENFDKILEKL